MLIVVLTLYFQSQSPQLTIRSAASGDDDYDNDESDYAVKSQSVSAIPVRLPRHHNVQKWPTGKAGRQSKMHRSNLYSYERKMAPAGDLMKRDAQSSGSGNRGSVHTVRAVTEPGTPRRFRRARTAMQQSELHRPLEMRRQGDEIDEHREVWSDGSGRSRYITTDL